MLPVGRDLVSAESTLPNSLLSPGLTRNAGGTVRR